LRKITKIFLRTNLFQAHRFIEQEEKNKISKGKKDSFVINDLSAPRVKENEISTKKLEMRYNEVIVRLRERIELHLPVVLTNADKLKELHEMRKDSKNTNIMKYMS